VINMSSATRRTKLVGVRLSADEDRMLAAMLEETGENAATFMRRMLHTWFRTHQAAQAKGATPST